MTTEITQTVPATDAEILAIMGQSDAKTYADTNQVRHPATGRIISGGDGAEDGLTVEFTTEAVFNKLLTFRAGGVLQRVRRQ